MELFGQHILDFPENDESLFCRLPGLDEKSHTLLDIENNWGLGHSGDEAESDSIFSEDSFSARDSDHDVRTSLDSRSEEEYTCDSLEEYGGAGGCRLSPAFSRPASMEPVELEDVSPGQEQEKEVEQEKEKEQELEQDPFSDLDLSGMLSVGKEELEEVARVSNLISGAHCDMIEELRNSQPPSPSLLETSLGLQEEELDCDLAQFDFDLAQETEMEKLQSDLQKLTEELSQDSSPASSLWAECFSSGASSAASSEYDDLLDSILSSPEHSLDPDYFNSEHFDIDSVDPTCLTEVKEEKEQEEEEEASRALGQLCFKNRVVWEEENEEEEPKEEAVTTELIKAEDIKVEAEESPAVHSSRLDHDYSLPLSSSLLITPPHSEEDSDCDSSGLPYRVAYSKSLLRPHASTRKLVRSQHRAAARETQVIKFQHKKDLKFVMSIEVKSEELRTSSPRSLLKSKLQGRERSRVQDLVRQEMAGGRQKSAKELVREIIEKRSRMEDLESKREQVKSMKRKLRQEGKAEEHRVSKQRCLTDLRSKPDLRKYRKFEEERELHNSMERQRRVELKDAYDGLKERIPSIAQEDKVSKLMILNTAADYCKGVEARLARLRRDRLREADRGRRLQERLNLLKIQVMI